MLFYLLHVSLHDSEYIRLNSEINFFVKKHKTHPINNRHVFITMVFIKKYFLNNLVFFKQVYI